VTLLSESNTIQSKVNLLANEALTATYDRNGNYIGIVAELNSQIVSNYNVTVTLATQMGYPETIHQQQLATNVTTWKSGKDTVEVNILNLAANHAYLYVLLQTPSGHQTATVLPLPDLNPCNFSGCTLSFAQVASFDSPYFRTNFAQLPNSNVMIPMTLVNAISSTSPSLTVVQTTADKAALVFLSGQQSGVAGTQQLWNGATRQWVTLTTGLFGEIFTTGITSPTSIGYIGAILNDFSALSHHANYQLPPVESADSYMLYATINIPQTQLAVSSRSLLTGGPSDCICMAVGTTTPNV